MANEVTPDHDIVDLTLHLRKFTLRKIDSYHHGQHRQGGSSSGTPVQYSIDSKMKQQFGRFKYCQEGCA